MRAAGEAHRAVVMSVSVGVRVEQLGGNTRHPSQEECSNKQLKKKKRRSYWLPQGNKQKGGKNGSIRKRNCGE
ncbi:hypothetical protein TCDM_12854 [Trypanosoma cruzi Dm28c]|uniref:Uncharacterized protein n=1 Tax=Trypanosoma cruzi Dm28c TaxID=1416333 RepID=V5CJX2_TRYCR|nr:hypothetical protein TCDM_12854 [Trypanosoma cruzi Dm28c]